MLMTLDLTLYRIQTILRDTLSRIEACAADILIWMNGNFLELNNEETELLIIRTREELIKRFNISIKVGDQSISPNDDPPRN